MLQTKRKPVTPGEMLLEEFMLPLKLTQTELASRSGLPRKHVNELCRNRRAITADTALILARVFGNSPDFWLNHPASYGSLGGPQHPKPRRPHPTRSAPGPDGRSRPISFHDSVVDPGL